ncbi:M1 family metallopeptidase [Pedomonas mirosovicensis]|uniref:M1 family metallopeptidase n=1 Tax=Pedomonas mirosovicensis TaxID=2908641 RepID=UPI00216A0329|nr:M1 family metallopeptidase [Pedomonas mirosovicensis]MCH8683864.1 M1 family metallopeptidase [Pedomonas mirosovicensis]
MRSLVAAACAGLLLSAAPAALAAPQSQRAAAPAVAPILTTPEAKDAMTYARPEIARVTHVDLDLAVDFDQQTLSGTAALSVLAQPGAKEIILDSENLAVTRVTDDKGRALPWTIGAAEPEKGAPLTVQLNGAKRIIVHYTARPGASALQWLPPALTAGKKKPFLFSQGQAINNRSWIPTQDSPGIRQTWTARLVVPEDLMAVMSAERLTPEGEPAGDGRRAFRFAMDKPVPPYLIALAVGDLAFRPLGPRTGVYAEPSMLDRAAYELADTEKMVEVAEKLYGPYRWGRYDVLVLPPAFPYGGMENPTLTFLTPTFLTGDRSNVNLVAHELAHSWSGNLVTNATWPDGWLNEGFTSYFENRIMEGMYGRERAVLEADLDWDVLMREIELAGGMDAPATRLRGDDGEESGQIDYIKGSLFLRTLETILGRERWDAYLTSYFNRHAFQPQTTAGFLADLRQHVVKGDKALEEKLQLDKWAYGTGLPDNAVRLHSEALAAVDAQVKAFAEDDASAASLQTKGWSTQEWLRFVGNLPRALSAEKLADLDKAFNLSRSPNAYVRSAWLELAIANRWEPAVPALEEFLNSVGRTLFLRPLYRELKEQGDWGMAIAKRAYATARDTYHPNTASTIDAILK